jgi:hypothetical protein
MVHNMKNRLKRIMFITVIVAVGMMASIENGFSAVIDVTAYGIYITNSFNTKILNCNVYNNARTGIVATTNPPDPDSNQNVSVVNCRLDNNAYNQLNFEEVSYGNIEKCVSSGSFSFRNSRHMRFINCIASSIHGADAADYPIIKNCYLTSTAYAIYTEGKYPLVEGCIIDPDGTPISNMVSVNSSDKSGIIKDCVILNCNNGIRSLLSSSAPTSDSWTVGDKVYNSVPSSAAGYIGWICVTAGAPGTWKGFGLIAN